MERQTGIPMGQPYSTVLISPPIIRLSSLSRSFSHSLTGSVPEAVLKNLAGRIFSESFIHMLYHIWYNMSSSMLYMNVTIELYGSVARMAITPSAKPRPKTIASAPTSQTGSPMLAGSQSVNNARGRPCRSLAETCSIPCGSTVSTCSRYSPPTSTGFSIELTLLIDISFVARIDISHFTKIGQGAFTSVIHIESYVNRLTFLKRQPVGRVPPDLLRLKVLPAVSSLMLLADTRPPLPPVSCPPRLPFRTSARWLPARPWPPPARHRWPRRGGSRRSGLQRCSGPGRAVLPCGWSTGWPGPPGRARHQPAPSC